MSLFQQTVSFTNINFASIWMTVFWMLVKLTGWNGTIYFYQFYELSFNVLLESLHQDFLSIWKVSIHTHLQLSHQVKSIKISVIPIQLHLKSMYLHLVVKIKIFFFTEGMQVSDGSSQIACIGCLLIIQFAAKTHILCSYVTQVALNFECVWA